jgi:class 3 adenylate cyclase
MTTCSLAEAAERSGVEPGYITRLVSLGIFTPAGPDRFTPADIRRVMMAKSLDEAGVPLDGLGAVVRSGEVSFDFLDAPAYERFAALAPETFRQVSERTGVPIEVLLAVRMAIGLAEPSPDDPMREDEMEVVPILELATRNGFRPVATERLLRVHGESVRRIAEQEGAWWFSEVVAPAMAAGGGVETISNADLSNEIAPLSERALLAMYHAHQARAWTANLIEGLEVVLDRAGLHSRLARPPAICFLDITGYTRLTQERGDDAAAELAATLARLVARSSVKYGGKPIKWLGDGVMFHFRDPGPGVRAALEMMAGLGTAGLPPAHVGLHTGPVLYQSGDYFGQTVNLTARIADYARPGEVLVTQAVADASHEAEIAFEDVGQVELKGVAGSTHLLRAHLA